MHARRHSPSKAAATRSKEAGESGSRIIPIHLDLISDLPEIHMHACQRRHVACRRHVNRGYPPVLRRVPRVAPLSGATPLLVTGTNNNLSPLPRVHTRGLSVTPCVTQFVHVTHHKTTTRKRKRPQSTVDTLTMAVDNLLLPRGGCGKTRCLLVSTTLRFDPLFPSCFPPMWPCAQTGPAPIRCEKD
jgi:hypothetical protein